VHLWRIHRERIAARLRRSADRRVALVVAPAGYGKSIAVRQSLDVAGGDAFYRVAPDTGTLLAFLRGLTEALEANVPGAHLSLALAHERAVQSRSPAGELARWLGEHLREAERLRIVIDDLHNASAPEIPEFLVAGIAAAPEQIRWLLATRDASALPVASWLAHGTCDVPLGETELRFEHDEIFALGAQSARALTDEQLVTIATRTNGWPSAAGLALTIGDGKVSTSHATPLQLYHDLARRVLDGLGEPRRSALVNASLYIDVPDASGGTSAYLDDLGDGRFRFDSLFRDFLLAQLRANGPDVERAALRTAAADYERSGDIRSALAFYQRANEPEAVSRLLARDGVALNDGGFADIVEAAIAMLDRNGFDGGPAVMLLKAIRDARFARFDSAEAWFQLAATAAAGNDDLRLQIVHRYALDLVRRGRVDVIDVLEPALQTAPSDHAFVPLLYATLATAYALVDRFDDARGAIAAAMDHLRPDLPDALRTRAYHQAAYVALRCADIAGAGTYAERVLEVAVPNGFYDLAARAHSILYEIAHAWDFDQKRALAHIELVAAYGLKVGDTHIRQWALLGAYYIEAERGNGTMMGTIERALNAPELLQTTEETNAALLPGQALRATWNGDFGHAFRLLTRSADGLVSADRRALRWAEIALFAAASDSEADAREAAAAAQRELASGHAGKHGTQAAAYLLIALSVLGDRMTWVTVHAALADAEPDSTGSCFFDVAEALHNHWHEKRDHNTVLAALNALRERNFGGIVAMIEALPAYPTRALQTLP
jgi:ATP/maltotriose-dependent transcriptional regulator MalT